VSGVVYPLHIPGQKYKVYEIFEDYYVVVEGFENSIPSALYWTEYVADIDAN
jgi:hypothetical protein